MVFSELQQQQELKMTYPKAYLYQRIVQSKLYIDENFAEDINVDNIAEEASFSKFHFIRLFKIAYGFSPRQYLIQKRIEFAKNKLTRNCSVTETYFESGFSSIGTFSTLFKTKTGMSPTQYKQASLRKHFEMKAKPQKFIPGCFLQKSNFQETSST